MFSCKIPKYNYIGFLIVFLYVDTTNDKKFFNRIIMVKSLKWKHNLTMNCDSLTDNLNTPSFIVELLSIILNFLFTGFFLYYIKLIVFKIRLSLNFCVWYELQTVFLRSEFSTVSLTPAAFIDPAMYWENDDNPGLRVCRLMSFPFLYFYTFHLDYKRYRCFLTSRKEKIISNEIVFYVTT